MMEPFRALKALKSPEPKRFYPQITKINRIMKTRISRQDANAAESWGTDYADYTDQGTRTVLEIG